MSTLDTTPVKPRQRPRLQDIADRVGISVAAVSRALRDDPKISEETRAEVERVAVEIGYRPDLAARSLRSGTGLYYETVAVVRAAAKEEFFTHPHCAVPDSLLRDSRDLGYPIEIHDVHLRGDNIEKNFKRLVSTLRARGIRGVMVTMLMTRPEDSPIEKLEDFTAVRIGGHSSLPNQNTVTFNYAQGMDRILRELRDRGYKKPALVLGEKFDRVTGQSFSNRFRARLNDFIPGAEPRVLRFPMSEYEPLLPELLEAEADCVICSPSTDFAEAILDDRRFREMGMCSLDQGYGKRRISGLLQPRNEIQEAAFFALVQQLRNSGGGFHPQSIQIQGDWVEGETLRARDEVA